jgi:phenylalanyl-tRNA synthetase beta subunit
LDENTIVISDDKHALDIAGIKGGHTSGIDENTKNVILSACNFDAISIRKTSKKLGLRTDASIRFENAISPELVDEAVELLSALVEKIAGGKVAADIIDIYPKKENKYKVGVSLLEINKLLGSRLSSRDVEKTLKRVKFEYKLVDPLKEILSLAPTLLGIPYKLGSSIRFDAPRFFDCSSLVSFLYVHAGIAIPRMSVDQYVFGEPVDIKKIQPGDLLFFTSEKPTHYKTLEFMPGTEVKEGIDHVALYMGNDKMIHATSKTGKVLEESFEKSEIRKFVVGVRRIITGKEKRFVVTVPSERLDIRIKEDLIEEIQRLSGYENIKTVKPKSRKNSLTVDKNLFYQEKIRKILTGLGFCEIYTYAFTDKGEVELLNPIASNKNFLRKNLADAMEQSLIQNAFNTDLHGLDKIKTFEIGSVFDSSGEAFSLSLGIKNRANIKAEVTKKELGEAMANLSSELGVVLIIPLLTNINNEVKNSVQNVVEINLSKLIENLPEPKKYESEEKSAKKYQYKKISPYPFIVRDIAVFVPTKIPAKRVLDKIVKMSGSMLVHDRLFDVFTKKFPDGSAKTSYAFRLVFQSDERTLTDEEINKIMDSVVEVIKKESDWQVR